MIKYRRDQNQDLTPDEVDDNFKELNERVVYLGTFATLNALNTAHPTPANGTYAFSTDRTTRWNRIEGQWQIESLGNAESAPQELYQNINELINAQATQSGDTLYYVGDATQDPAVVARGTVDAYYIYSGQANGLLSDYMLQPVNAFAPVVLDAGQNITIVNDVVDVKIPPFEIVSAILGTTGLGSSHIAIDSQGNVYTANVSSNNVTKITPAGVSTILGTTGLSPFGIAIDSLGNIYTANFNSKNVTKITPAGVSTILGTTGTRPRAIAIDSSGNIYTANRDSNNVTKITPAGVSTILGTTGSTPFGIAIDSLGNIYTANIDVDNVTKITPAGVSTILGTTGLSPYDIAIDLQGNIYTTNADSENVTKITPAGVSTILGTTSLSPRGIAIDLQGNIYTANLNSNNVTKITPAGVSSILSTTGSNPQGITIDLQGNIYTANQNSNNVTKITIDTRRNLAIDDAGNIVRTDLPEEITAVSQLETDIVKGASYFNDFDGFLSPSTNDGNFFAQGAGGGVIGLESDGAFDEDDVLILRCTALMGSRAAFFNINTTTVAYKNIEYMVKLRVANLATTENKFLFMYGRASTAVISSSTTCYGFIYDKAGGYLGTASDNWLAVTRNGLNSTVVDTGIPVIDSAYVRLMIKYTPNSIAYFINGVLVATITTNINTSTGHDILAIQKTAAGTTNQDVFIDYYSRTQTKITPRIYDN